ncbi:hypothetical protein [Mesorhizobium sp. M0130]|uniref:hypothetical protein n=1 Tax=Mesorhizobium sp. M0130 TaxID=2956887 RepID=UPI0033353255
MLFLTNLCIASVAADATSRDARFGFATTAFLFQRWRISGDARQPLSHGMRISSAVPAPACCSRKPSRGSIDSGDGGNRLSPVRWFRMRSSIDASIWPAAPNDLFDGLIWPKVGFASIA